MAFAQENLAFSNDKFSGINSAAFSPTQPFLNSNPWDVNLFSESINFDNDYAYISDESFLSLRNSNIQTANIKQNITGGNTSGVLDFYNKNFGSYYFSSDLLGPSFSLKTKIKEKDFQLGIFTRLRTHSSAFHVDNYLKFGNQAMTEPENYTLQPINLTTMNWGEIGFNASTEIFPYAEQKWIIGANFKYEMGFDALNINSMNAIQLTKTYEQTNGVQKKTIIASNYNIEANIATNYNFETKKYELQKQGQGAGLDFGIVMIDKDKNTEDYNFKASLSVLDLGKVNFQGRKDLFKGNSLKILNNSDFKNTKFRNPQQYLEFLSKEVYGDEKTSLQGTAFSVGLPTSAHLNLSKNITENTYLNLDWIQRTPVFENSLKRSNIINVSYTIQKTYLGYGGSVTLYEYQKLQFGGYLRIGPLIIGSSNFFPLIFKQKKLNSGDFFIGLKIYPFWDNEFKRHRRADCNCDK